MYATLCVGSVQHDAVGGAPVQAGHAGGAVGPVRRARRRGQHRRGGAARLRLRGHGAPPRRRQGARQAQQAQAALQGDHREY